MRYEFARTENLSLRLGFLPSQPLRFLLNVVLITWLLMARVPVAKAQAADSETKDGTISGTVLLKASNRPASQVAVKLKSHVAGIFRSVLTDLEGHFEVRSLPPSTYEIMVDEPGYEPAQTSAKLDGASSKLVLYLNSPHTMQSERNGYTVSARELKIPGKARREFEKGLGSLAKQDVAGSLSHFTKATEAFPDYYEAYYHVGVAATRLGQRDEAMQAFQKAIDASGGRYALAEFGIGYLVYLEGKPEEAATIIRRGLEVDPSSPDGYLILGMAQLRLNRPDEAERSAREALLRNPNFAHAYLVLSDACGYRHEYRAQLQDLDAYLKLEPNGAESEHVRKAREVVLRILAKSHLED
ncbi:MAG TPA: tetratricopeptide repeat protein [Candidatus Acidoferrales bacterium]|nr:tetratricopeptide repeat protein [Candidatus Acidoferrales bacterium]